MSSSTAVIQFKKQRWLTCSGGQDYAWTCLSPAQVQHIASVCVISLITLSDYNATCTKNDATFNTVIMHKNVNNLDRYYKATIATHQSNTDTTLS